MGWKTTAVTTALGLALTFGNASAMVPEMPEECFDREGFPITNRIVGTLGDDILIGTPCNDLIIAGDGDDIVYGLGGDDRIVGGPGNDELHGDEGNDVLSGQEGNDDLHGGEGNDVLSGQEGDDTLRGGPGNDELHGGTDPDRPDVDSCTVGSGSEEEFTVTGCEEVVPVQHLPDPACRL